MMSCYFTCVLCSMYCCLGWLTNSRGAALRTEAFSALLTPTLPYPPTVYQTKRVWDNESPVSSWDITLLAGRLLLWKLDQIDLRAFIAKAYHTIDGQETVGNISNGLHLRASFDQLLFQIMHSYHISWKNISFHKLRSCDIT